MCKILWLGCLISGSVWAVEASPAQRYSLVGIISESKANAVGIAVLRDETNQRTLTLRSGEFLPGDTAFQLHRVEKGQVILSDGDANIALTFSGRSKDSQDAEEVVEETTQMVAAAADADDKEASAGKTARVARSSSLSKIIWPGDDDTITFEQIEEHNRLLLKQIPAHIDAQNPDEESRADTESEYDGESRGH